jgi:hypothetical protein
MSRSATLGFDIFLFYYMSRSIDPDCPQELTTAQASSVNEWPEIAVLIQRRDTRRQQLGRPLSQHRGSPKYECYQKLN